MFSLQRRRVSNRSVHLPAHPGALLLSFGKLRREGIGPQAPRVVFSLQRRRVSNRSVHFPAHPGALLCGSGHSRLRRTLLHLCRGNKLLWLSCVQSRIWEHVARTWQRGACPLVRAQRWDQRLVIHPGLAQGAEILLLLDAGGAAVLVPDA